jgi:hypothetical protein
MQIYEHVRVHMKGCAIEGRQFVTCLHNFKLLYGGKGEDFLKRKYFETVVYLSVL